VFHIEGQVKAEVATRLMVYPDGTLKSDIEDADLVAQIRDDAWKALDDSRSIGKILPLTHRVKRGFYRSHPAASAADDFWSRSRCRTIGTLGARIGMVCDSC
jgi:hypothetical protein